MEKHKFNKKITLYNKSGGKFLLGLVRRRKAEKELFLNGGGDSSSSIFFTYSVRTNGRVLPAVTNTNDYAGNIGSQITDIQ